MLSNINEIHISKHLDQSFTQNGSCRKETCVPGTQGESVLDDMGSGGGGGGKLPPLLIIAPPLTELLEAAVLYIFSLSPLTPAPASSGHQLNSILLTFHSQESV